MAALRRAALPQPCSDAEWDARIEAAAAHRIVAHYEWDYLIYNHVGMRVPGEDAMLVKPHRLRFAEVRASDLVKVPIHADTAHEDVQAVGYAIHRAVMGARPDVNCTVHVHPRAAVVMSARKDPFTMIDQGAMLFYGDRLSHHDFEGQAGLDESERIARDLGPTNMAMMLRNHGPITCGRDANEALHYMYWLIELCEMQLMLEASGKEYVTPSKEVCAHTARQWDRHHDTLQKDEWPAYLRMLDKMDPSYRD